MTTPSDGELERGLAALDAGRCAEAYRILRPLADAGHVRAQACLGMITLDSLHRFPDMDAYGEWLRTVTPEQFAAFHEQHDEADREQAVAWLRAASDGGDGEASHTLAITYLTGIGEEGWGGRKQRVLELLARAEAQGVPCRFNDGQPPGAATLRALEQLAADAKRPSESGHRGEA